MPWFAQLARDWRTWPRSFASNSAGGKNSKSVSCPLIYSLAEHKTSLLHVLRAAVMPVFVHEGGPSELSWDLRPKPSAGDCRSSLHQTRAHRDAAPGIPGA